MRTFLFNARVYFSDTDAEGIVYHARYLDWAEHARTEMLREMLPDVPQSELAKGDDGIFIIVRSISMDFRSPGHLDDLLEVRTTILDMQRFSCTIHQEIFRGDDPLCTLDVKVAFISAVTRKPHLIPEFIKNALSE